MTPMNVAALVQALIEIEGGTVIKIQTALTVDGYAEIVAVFTENDEKQLFSIRIDKQKVQK